MVNEIIFFSIPAYNLARLKSFYEDIFGWKFTLENKKEEIWSITLPKNKGKFSYRGLLMKKRPLQVPMNYIHVDSIEKYLKKISERGGKTYVDKTLASKNKKTWYAVVTDPEGNPFMLWEEK